MSGSVWVGTSGWRYPPWRGHFYPKGLAQRRELEYLSRQLGTMELNGSFYSLQRPTSYQLWYESTPDDFLFSVKGPRFVTHVERLRDVKTALANFFASGVLALGAKLGPVLWQLPPSLRYDPDLLAEFLGLLPRTTAAAMDLAQQESSGMEGREWTAVDADRPLRHALEVRNRGFLKPEFVELMREQGIASVVADTAGKWPRLDDVTADFVYVRLHGDTKLYYSRYGDEALDEWAGRIRLWRDGKNVRGEHTVAPPAPYLAGGRDVYVYFDNTAEGHAPFDAKAMAARLGVDRP